MKSLNRFQKGLDANPKLKRKWLSCSLWTWGGWIAIFFAIGYPFLTKSTDGGWVSDEELFSQWSYPVVLGVSTLVLLLLMYGLKRLKTWGERITHTFFILFSLFPIWGFLLFGESPSEKLFVVVNMALFSWSHFMIVQTRLIFLSVMNDEPTPSP